MGPNRGAIKCSVNQKLLVVERYGVQSGSRFHYKYVIYEVWWTLRTTLNFNVLVGDFSAEILVNRYGCC